MITLETEFASSAGGFLNEPLTYKQVVRSSVAAVYVRSRDGIIKDYEAFTIRIDPKGKVQKFPNGVVKVIEDDTENYPSTGQFGISAWTYKNKGAALAKFEALNNESTEDKTASVKEMLIPVKEFTVKELAEFNQVEYPIAAIFVRESLAVGKIQFLRAERRNLTGKGKPSNIYSAKTS